MTCVSCENEEMSKLALSRKRWPMGGRSGSSDSPAWGRAAGGRGKRRGDGGRAERLAWVRPGAEMGGGGRVPADAVDVRRRVTVHRQAGDRCVPDVVGRKDRAALKLRRLPGRGGRHAAGATPGPHQRAEHAGGPDKSFLKGDTFFQHPRAERAG